MFTFLRIYVVFRCAGSTWHGMHGTWHMAFHCLSLTSSPPFPGLPLPFSGRVLRDKSPLWTKRTRIDAELTTWGAQTYMDYPQH